MKKLILCFILCIVCAPAFAQDAAEQPEKILDIQELQTESGISAWLVEDHTVPVIALHFAFKGAGASGDGPDKQGLARLASNTMDEGAGQLDSHAFQEELRREVISLRFSSNRDMFGGVVQTRSSTRDRAFELLRLALNEPRFDEQPLERMRAANLARIRNGLSDPNWVSARIANDRFFEGHPYALNSGGTLSSLGNITADDLRDFATTRLAQDNLHVAIVGDITAENAKQAIDNIFANLPESANLPAVADINVQNVNTLAVFEAPIPQTIISAVQDAPPREHDDYFAFTVMNHILGASGFGSRLTQEIREKRGLTYGIYSYPQYMDHINTLNVSVATANENAGQVLDLLTAEMKRIQDEPVSAQERDETISYLIGSFPLTLSSTSSIAGLLLNMQVEELSVDYINERRKGFESVTIADIQKAAQTYLTPDNLAIIMIGQPQGLDHENVIKLTTLPNVE